MKALRNLSQKMNPQSEEDSFKSDSSSSSIKDIETNKVTVDGIAKKSLNKK